MTTSTSLSPVRWGILGASRFAQTKSVPGMMKSPLVHVVALASRDLAKAQTAAGALGIANAMGSYEALLADETVEAVYIPLPNHLHVPWAVAALNAGKHVLCEKPIALSAEQLAPLAQAQRTTGRLLAEAFMVRTHPQWQAARTWVQKGRIGAVRSLTCAFSYTNTDAGNIRNQRDIGGGALYDIGCYPVNTARFILAREPLRVIATCDRDPQSGVDRLTSGMLDFGDAHATFTVGTQHVPYQRVQILGTLGRIEIEIPFNAPPDQACRVWLDPGHDVFGAGKKEVLFPAVDQYMLQAEAFSRSVRENTPHENDVNDALLNARVLDALFRSLELATWQSP
ncbi:MAG: Gfo/Idh/MocA family oxidoreductase [Deltaproteobacteria bacterium]|nr:Gfo/Idh/MocA family oxidoreductase [Deltaproteobacteria bacterium]